MNVSIKGHSITFNGLLTIVFIMLKLQGVINWSWIWVLCPLWIPLVLGLSIFIAFFAAFIGATVFTTRRRYF